MTMAVKITNADSNTNRAIKVEVTDHGEMDITSQQALLGPGESFTAYVHSSRDVRLSEVESGK